MLTQKLYVHHHTIIRQVFVTQFMNMDLFLYYKKDWSCCSHRRNSLLTHNINLTLSFTARQKQASEQTSE